MREEGMEVKGKEKEECLWVGEWGDGEERRVFRGIVVVCMRC